MRPGWLCWPAMPHPAARSIRPGPAGSNGLRRVDTVRKPAQICGAPGCRTLTEGGRCDAHRRVREQQRGSACSRGYGRAHRHWREMVLQRDLYTCQSCGHLDTDISRMEADHIVPMTSGGAALELENGQCLCRSCHSTKTQRENG
jgi:5-methylcytosine-specific restriction protein A